MEDYLNDSSRLRIELEKADALRELRPHLQGPERRSWFRSRNIVQAQASEEPIKAYLARIVHAHLRCLIESEVLRRDVDIEAFTNRAVEDAKKLVDNAAVNSMAEEIHQALVDVCRVVYLRELNLRRQEWEACPIHSSLNDDPEYEEKVRVEWEAMRAAREIENQASQPKPQVADGTPTQAAEPPVQPQPAIVANAGLAERPAPVEALASGTAARKAEAESPGRERKGDVTLINGKHAVTFRTAEEYLGISERQRQNLIHDGILKTEGLGQNRKITTETLRTYLPPENPK